MTDTQEGAAPVVPLAVRLLTKADILGASDMKYEDVPTPEWAPADTDPATCMVRVRNLTALGRGYFIQRPVEARLRADAALKAGMTPEVAQVAANNEIEMVLVVASACDEKGDLIFTLDDVKALGAKPSEPVSRCAAMAQKLSGMLPNDAATAAKS